MNRAVVVFGDSLSDTGNAGMGRFSNGPVWVERLAERLGTRLTASSQGGTNYAVGGARTVGTSGPTSLRAQVDGYLRKTGRQADPKALYVVYGGGNDLRAAVGASDPWAAVMGAAGTMGHIIADLAKAGATEFLVPNLPDLGRIPEIRRYGPNAVQIATMASIGYNQTLARSLDEVEQRLPIRLHRLDVWALLQTVLADPAAAGFANVTEPCVAQGPCRDPDRFLFWDSIHPTAAAHARLAEAALGAVSGVSQDGRR
ncbi:SGNH/GDSL hydrolase family protein [Azospirillum soli]|uniref:SGNH/GDSL hydrolase family protein n=1 Tax=Azospirillum soli TaxID=1304799 RepID=UPI001AE906CA|nr:SGNH/GDSL hydrolase family protein [Azospirillum soli]MBP2313079.1 outer membrane lipase/esterase [Azospirillum soli]